MHNGTVIHRYRFKIFGTMVISWPISELYFPTKWFVFMFLYHFFVICLQIENLSTSSFRKWYQYAITIARAFDSFCYSFVCCWRLFWNFKTCAAIEEKKTHMLWKRHIDTHNLAHNRDKWHSFEMLHRLLWIRCGTNWHLWFDCLFLSWRITSFSYLLFVLMK